MSGLLVRPFNKDCGPIIYRYATLFTKGINEAVKQLLIFMPHAD
jgi:hypothetical protein